LRKGARQISYYISHCRMNAGFRKARNAAFMRQRRIFCRAPFARLPSATQVTRRDSPSPPAEGGEGRGALQLN
jgi:hypothetical protein